MEGKEGDSKVIDHMRDYLMVAPPDAHVAIEFVRTSDSSRAGYKNFQTAGDADEYLSSKNARSLRFNPDQPRDPDGKFASGGGNGPAPQKPYSEWTQEEKDKLWGGPGKSEPTLDQKLSTVGRMHDIMTDKLGVSKDWAAGHLVVSFDKPPMYTLGGEEKPYGGSANLNNGIITMYPRAYGEFDPKTGTYPEFERQAGGILAHEVMHDKFESVLTQYYKERSEFNALPREEQESMQRPDGSLDSEKTPERFNTYQKLDHYLVDNSQEMYKEDGCTRYSKEWWKEWNDGKCSTKLAIHETLAEQGRLDYEKQSSGGGALGRADGISANWMGLHMWVNTFAREGKFGQ